LPGGDGDWLRRQLDAAAGADTRQRTVEGQPVFGPQSTFSA